MADEKRADETSELAIQPQTLRDSASSPRLLQPEQAEVERSARFAPVPPPQWPDVLPYYLQSDPLASVPPEQWPQRIPGDPERIAHLTQQLNTTGGNIEDQRNRLGNVRTEMFWKSDAASKFDGLKESLQPKLKAVGRRYDKTAHALKAYHPELREAQQMAKRAAREGEDAKAQIMSLRSQSPYPTFLPADVHTNMPVQPKPQPQQDTTQLQPMHVTDSARIEISPPRWPWPDDYHERLREAYERFGGAMYQMHQAEDKAADAAKRCANHITEAADDKLVNAEGFNDSLATLKRKLNAQLGDLAPQLREQISRLGGVAGLIAWVPMAAAMATDKGEAKQLLKHVEAWKDSKTGGKKVVDSFIDILTPNIEPFEHPRPLETMRGTDQAEVKIPEFKSVQGLVGNVWDTAREALMSPQPLADLREQAGNLVSHNVALPAR